MDGGLPLDLCCEKRFALQQHSMSESYTPAIFKILDPRLLWHVRSSSREFNACRRHTLFGVRNCDGEGWSKNFSAFRRTKLARTIVRQLLRGFGPPASRSFGTKGPLPIRFPVECSDGCGSHGPRSAICLYSSRRSAPASLNTIGRGCLDLAERRLKNRRRPI